MPKRPVQKKVRNLIAKVSKAIKKAVKKPAKKKTVSRKATIKKKSIKAPARKMAARRRAVSRRPQIVVSEPERIAVHTEDDRVPRYYGDDKLFLLVRDPWWLYAYWEITPGHRKAVEDQARRNGHRDWITVLRVYDVTKGGPERPDSFFDIELHFYTDNWYIDVGIPGRLWMAELGLRTPRGAFFALVRSNIVGTPPFGLSDVLDEEWMLPEDVFLKIIGLTGPGGQSGSMDIRKLLEKYLKRVVSSESSPRAPLAR